MRTIKLSDFLLARDDRARRAGVVFTEARVATLRNGGGAGRRRSTPRSS